MVDWGLRYTTTAKQRHKGVQVCGDCSNLDHDITSIDETRQQSPCYRSTSLVAHGLQMAPTHTVHKGEPYTLCSEPHLKSELDL